MASILDWRGHYYTVDDLASETGLAQRDNGLYLSELSALLKLYGVESKSTIDIKAEIDLGHPCISLVFYGPLSSRQNKADVSMHFVLVLAYNENGIICHDPDFWSPIMDQGNKHFYPWSEWNRAFISAIAII